MSHYSTCLGHYNPVHITSRDRTGILTKTLIAGPFAYPYISIERDFSTHECHPSLNPRQYVFAVTVA